MPTIRDVAKHAEVSISTVSRVLNKSASVDEAKRKRVEAAALELGYSPNPNALGLLGQRTGGIGVLLPYVAGEFFSEFLQGIDRTTGDSGHFLMVSSSHRKMDAFKAVIQGMKHRVDGLIIMSTQVPAETVRAWLPDRLPILFVNTEVQSAEVETINFDNRGGAYALTEHLIEQGHRRVAFLKGPVGSYDAIARLDGFRAALQDHGIEPTPALEYEGDFTLEAGRAAVLSILASDPRPTAIFAANDLSAYGVLSGLREAGIRVPEDMALAGFDDVLLTQFSSPTLTTVHAPAREMGQRAIERLLEHIDGTSERAQGSVVLPTHVVTRESTAIR